MELALDITPPPEVCNEILPDDDTPPPPPPETESESSRKLATEKGHFPCDECGKVCTTKLALARHKVSVHGAPNKKEKKRARENGLMDGENTSIPNVDNGTNGTSETSGTSGTNGTNGTSGTTNPPAAKKPNNTIALPDFESEAKTKQELLTKLKMLETKYGKKIGYKCQLTLDAPLPKIQAEQKLVLELIQGKCGVEVAYNGLLVVAKGIESATQQRSIKPFCDLEGYPDTLNEKKDEIFQALDELLQEHPEMAAYVKPEIKLLLIMSSAAIGCASNNKILREKKNSKIEQSVA